MKDKISLKRSEKLELASAIYEQMLNGSSDVDIIDNLGLDTQTYYVVKKFLLENKGGEELQTSSKERFASYVIKQEQNIKDLNDLITNLNSKTQYNALVGAIRLRSDILDRIISTGQTLGVIDKEPEKKVFVGGVAISDIGDKELKKGIIKAVSGLNKLMKKYGNEDSLTDLHANNLYYGKGIDALPEDVSSTASYGAPLMKEDKVDNKNKAKTSKRFAGRRKAK